jgi:hypothetical protein
LTRPPRPEGTGLVEPQARYIGLLPASPVYRAWFVPSPVALAPGRLLLLALLLVLATLFANRSGGGLGALTTLAAGTPCLSATAEGFTFAFQSYSRNDDSTATLTWQVTNHNKNDVGYVAFVRSGQLWFVDLVFGGRSDKPSAHSASACTVLARVRSRPGANLREGPGTHFPIVGGAIYSQTVTLIGQHSDRTWYQLDSRGWMADDVLELPGSTCSLPYTYGRVAFLPLVQYKR